MKTYDKDGLAHCATCHEPRQHKINIGGQDILMKRACSCEMTQYAAQAAEAAERDHWHRVRGMRAVGIPDTEMRKWTFAADDGIHPEQSAKIRRYVSVWEDMRRDNVGLLFWGDVGTGKTYMAACVANALIDRLIPAYVTGFSKIINDLWNAENKTAYIDRLCRYELLVIDDLGAERQSEYAQEIVYSVIDARYRARRPLIVTTNLTLDEIRKPGDLSCRRIYDRILELCVPIGFKGTSRRADILRRKLENAGAVLNSNPSHYIRPVAPPGKAEDAAMSRMMNRRKMEGNA